MGQREREMGIRAALGAPAKMLRRQLLAENLVLSVMGGLLGLALSVAGLNLLIAYTSRFTNRVLGAERGAILRMILGEGVAMALLGLAIGVAAAAAWAPARGATSVDPMKALRGDGVPSSRPSAAAPRCMLYSSKD